VAGKKQKAKLLDNGLNIIQEHNAIDNSRTDYIFAGMRRIAEKSSGVVRYYHTDHLGSTRLITDSQGSIVAEYKYYPYGANLAQNIQDPSFDGATYRFTGKSDSPNTGLYYFGARFYDPEVGRFITLDPARDGLNWYEYCAGNPLGYVDPDGEFAIAIPFLAKMFAASAATVGVKILWDCREPIAEGVSRAREWIWDNIFGRFADSKVGSEDAVDSDTFYYHQGCRPPSQNPPDRRYEDWTKYSFSNKRKSGLGGGNRNRRPDWGTAIPISYVLASKHECWEYWVWQLEAEIASFLLALGAANRKVEELVEKNKALESHNEPFGYSWQNSSFVKQGPYFSEP
jgi:RHS repeat-associated protein